MKTIEQAKAMIVVLETELARLPKFNAFGGSNAESIQELTQWHFQLSNFVKTGKDDLNKSDECSRWIHGLDSALSDCE